MVGSGVSGGWAAKELTEQGLKTLVIERGHHVEVAHCVDAFQMLRPEGVRYKAVVILNADRSSRDTTSCTEPLP